MEELEVDDKCKKGANHHLREALSRVAATGIDQKEAEDDAPGFLLAQAEKGTDANNFLHPVLPPPITA